LWTLVAAGLILPVMSVFVAATGSLQDDDTILGGSLTGAVLAQMISAVFGALVMSGEYATGMIRTTLTAAPRRVAVLGAKAVTVAAVLFVVTLPASALAFLLGTQLLDGDKYATGEPLPALVGIALAMAMSGLLGLALGTILRHSAGAVAAVAGVILLPALFGPLFGSFQRWIGGAAPSGALEKLTQTSDASHETVGALGPWPSLTVVLAYVVLVLAGSAWLLRSRDA
jgi:ABC-2 type transport system permease protein